MIDLSLSEQELIESRFADLGVLVFSDGLEISCEVSFSRLKALVEAIEEFGGLIDPGTDEIEDD